MGIYVNTCSSAHVPDRAQWYVAVVKPGGGAVAAPRLDRHVVVSGDERFVFHCDQRPPERHGEVEVERSLRDAGFSCYRPMMRKEIVHHRTKKLIVRAFPLFTGYIFVNAGADEIHRVARCDFVAAILGADGVPVALPPIAVEGMMRAEAAMEFDDTREAKRRREIEERHGRSRAREKFPPGAVVRVRDAAANRSPFYGFHGRVKGINGRGMVKTMIDFFGRTVPVEFPAADLEVVDRPNEAA